MMRELEAEELESVGGGILPLLAALGFVWYQAPQIQSFFQGYFDGVGSVKPK
jgi:hypothetical protein